MFIVNGALKTAEKDNWENGYNPESTFMVNVDLYFSKETIEELIEELKIYYGDYFEIDPCGEDKSRIDFSRYENAGGEEASEHEMELFKQGKIDLWHVTYSCIVLKTEEINLHNYNLK